MISGRFTLPFLLVVSALVAGPGTAEPRFRRVEGEAGGRLFHAAAAGRAEAPATRLATVDFGVYPGRPRAGDPVAFLDRSTGAPVSWEWSFGDGGTSAERNPTHVYASPGTYFVTLRASGPGGVLTAEKPVTVSAKDTGTGSAMTYLLPVVLTASGQGGTRFSTELTLTNLTSAPLPVVLTAKGSAGGAGFESSATFSLPPGQVVQPDAWAFLRSIGMAVPAGDPIATLRAAVEGLSDLSLFRAQARVTTPPNQGLLDAGIRGRFGLAFGATPLTYGADSAAVLYGLQQSASSGARSNVACVNAGALRPRTDEEGNPLPSDPLVSVEIEYVDGATGVPHASKDRMDGLQPFEWRQLSRPLEPRGIGTGYAVVRRTAGDAQFLCYGVVNDNVNGDGAYIPMFVVDAEHPGNRAFLPVVLEASGYQTEVSFTNRHSKAMDVLLTLVLAGSPDQPQYAAVRLVPGEQLVSDNVMATLRAAGLAAPVGSVGSLFVQLEEAPGVGEPGGRALPLNLGSVTARTFTVRQGGKFGLAYGATPVGEAAEAGALVLGLQQTGTRGVTEGTRANLAVLNAAGRDEEAVDVEITYFGPDGAELGKQADCAPCRLKPGEWRQFNAVLGGSNGFTASTGYARVERKTGTDQVFAYGVLNDQLNDDGSFVPMVVR